MNQPTVKELKFIVRSWDLILKEIPTEWLTIIYEQAMRQHKGGPFGVYEMCRAWNAIEETAKKEEKAVLIIDQNLKVIQYYRDLEARGEEAFNNLSPDERDQLLASKIEELLGSDYGPRYLNWDDKHFFDHVIDQVKKDLAKKALSTSDPFKR